jgi:quercetin dioxygenase-like cupin family protein
MSFTRTESREFKPSKGLNATRIEIAQGTVSESEGHASETIVIVLEGVWRFRLAGRVVTLKKDEVLRIPALERYSSEAIADTIALQVTTSLHSGSQRVGSLPEDADEYLWGV